MATSTKLIKVRAGWYETEDGRFAVYELDSGFWNLCEYVANPVDGGLDLISTGQCEWTLQQSRLTLNWLATLPIGEAAAR